MEQNATLTISPDVMMMLGRKLYSSHPLIIVTRELLQNSVDACKRHGVNPEITIEIEEDSNGIVWVRCTDNGEGMTSNTLLNKFLCLGESGKRDSKGGVGGFGIAKAAIMSNPFWSVHTHDLYTASTALNKPLKNVNYLDGTKVSVKITEAWYDNTIKEMLAMIYLSDVSVHLIYKKNGETRINDKYAGLQKKLTLDHTDQEDRFAISLLTNINPRRRGFTNFSGGNYYRLNGLVQFASHAYDRKTNVIIELFTNKSPVDDEYPLSMSRETIQTSLTWTIRKKIQHYNQNALSTESTIARGEIEKKIATNKGREMVGQQVDEYGNYTYSNNTSDALEFDNLPAVGKLQSITIYRDDKPTTEEKRILRLWAGLLALTADIADRFGVGITGDVSTIASRQYENGHDYYLINTEKIIKEDHDMDELIFRLHMLAAHETCHYELESHNEIFTSAMDKAYTKSIKAILRNMPKLRTIVRNNYR